MLRLWICANTSFVDHNEANATDSCLFSFDAVDADDFFVGAHADYGARLTAIRGVVAEDLRAVGVLKPNRVYVAVD